jgi:G3E family GTPase
MRMKPYYLLFSQRFLFWNFCRALSTPAPVYKQIPITVISGFLGSGKTTLLQKLLQNKEGLRIAVIVNDVASVNIDSKLVSGSSSADGMIELQNGCACCSLASELLGGVSELVTLSDMRAESDAFDHIVVELSGVADPKGVRSQFQEATFYNMPIMERVRLDTMVTVVDCSVFLKHLRSSKVRSYYYDLKSATQL